ncbi:hypothetical protein [Borreliella americana]|uniref:hypothetical protein n=1 Tax=Borreliella americana TaxID=478807 RepID=UPI001E5DEF82|nr:hypothetical protein [Borreliella americana]MCD2382022.1 hypothetical protein [Borreliella americana]
MKVIALLMFFLLIPDVSIFSNEVIEKIAIINNSNMSDLTLLLTSKTKFGTFALKHFKGYIDLEFNVKIANNTKLVLNKWYINGISLIESPINSNPILGINNFSFDINIINETELFNQIKKSIKANGIEAYMEYFDEKTNKKKQYTFKVGKKNSIDFFNAFDMLVAK